ncbi:hypothetical protein ACFQ1I_20050 [Kitasatospora arboriphila]
MHGLGRLEAVLTAAQALRGLTDLQAVAMPRLLTGRAARTAGRSCARRSDWAPRRWAVARRPTPTRSGTCRCCWRPPARRTSPSTCTVRAPTRALARMTGVLAPLRPRVTLGPCDALAPGASTVLASAGVRVVCLPQSGGCAAASALPAVCGPPWCAS